MTPLFEASLPSNPAQAAPVRYHLPDPDASHRLGHITPWHVKPVIDTSSPSQRDDFDFITIVVILRYVEYPTTSELLAGNTKRRFAMISPYFPPSSFVGAKRALTFCRNLPAEGWTPSVITLPVHIERDIDLEPLIPDVPTYRHYRTGPMDTWLTRKELNAKPKPFGDNRGQNTHSRGIWQQIKKELTSLPFDRYAKFIPWAAKGCQQFIESEGCDLIHVNAGPFSGLILGTMLSKRTGLPLVLDLRDPWAHDPIYSDAWGVMGTALAKKIEKWAFTQASRVVMNSESAVGLYREAYADILPATHFEVIRNHFDEALYDPLPAPPGAHGPFRVIFFGHLTPLRNGQLFFEAWRRFIDREKLVVGDAILLTLGERTAADDDAVEALSLTDFVGREQWQPFIRSRQLLGTADVLLDLTSPRHGLRIAGKLYDYLCARRPILSVSNNPEVAQIHAEAKVGHCVSHDVDAIVEALSDLYRRKRDGIPFEPNLDVVHQFSAGPAAAKMARIFHEVIENAQST
jgi:glycosyltransferase involved in cell wall biosynthesis